MGQNKISAEDLIEASADGNIQEVLQLLDVKKVNVNCESKVGLYGSALGAAAYQGMIEIISILLDRGADVNITCGEYGSALGAAAASGERDTVSLPLNRGANVNFMDGKYGTALITAAYHGHQDIVSLLIAWGADVNAASHTGQYGTALATAALRGDMAIASLLLGCGANANIVGGDYGTALAAASYNGHGDIISKLLGYRGIDINTLGGQYGTALSAAFAGTSTYEAKLHITNLPLDHGADINLVDCMYGSPLGKAAYKGDKELASLLLPRGADAFHVGGRYETTMGEYPTALDAARAGGASENVITLLSESINKPILKSDIQPWPPFPMPFRGSVVALQVPREPLALASTIRSCHDFLETIVKNTDQTPTWDGHHTPAQADLPCKTINEELLRSALLALVGVRPGHETRRLETL